MQEKRDLLDVLQKELEFLENGGYRNPARCAWRYQFLFEDSPTCPNYCCSGKPHACTECVLMDLVPAEHRSTAIPCRDIPLNAEGETLRQLYTYADELEIEQKYTAWLSSTIVRLKEERTAKTNSPHVAA